MFLCSSRRLERCREHFPRSQGNQVQDAQIDYMASLQFEHETLGLKYFGGPGHDFGLPQSTLSGQLGHVLFGGLPVDISPSMIPSLYVTPEAVSRLLRRKGQRRVSAAQRSFPFASSV